MLKKIGLPLVALLAAFTFVAPKPAQAGVRFGIAIGAPAYGYRGYAAPYYGYGYGYGYNAPYNYGYADQAYVAPAYPYAYGSGVTIGVGGYYGGRRYYDHDRYRGYYNRGYYNRGYYGGWRR